MDSIDPTKTSALAEMTNVCQVQDDEVTLKHDADVICYDEDVKRKEKENEEEAEDTVSAASRVEPMLHGPLPNAFKRDAVYKARGRVARFDVFDNERNHAYKVIYDRKRPNDSKVEREGEEENDRETRKASSNSDLLCASSSAVGSVMDAMSDFLSHSVVPIGGQDRLGDNLAKKKLREYTEYEVKRGQNLIRMPKCSDAKFKKGSRWKKL